MNNLPQVRRKTFTINDVRYYKKSSGWFLATTVDGETVTGTAIIPPYGTFTGDARFEINRYGEQWHMLDLSYPDLEGVTLSLLKGNFIEGIADHKAQSVFECFGVDVWNILEAGAREEDYELEDGRMVNPKTLLQDADGVGPIVSQDMIDSWKENREFFSIAMNAIRCNMKTWQWKRIGKDGVRAAMFDAMVHNRLPHSVYDLVQFGLKFDECDKIALQDWADKPALAMNDPIRLAGIIKFLVADHTVRWGSPYAGGACLPLDAVNELALEEYSVEDILGQLPEDPSHYGLVNYNGFLYPSKYFEKELYIVKAIVRNMKRDTVKKLLVKDEYIQEIAGEDITLSDEQLNAIKTCLANPVSVVLGGPGVGKTTILRVLKDILADYYQEIHLAAFTGAASRRMQLATGHEAKTLHMTFGLSKESTIPMNGGTLIIDEMSMNSSPLMYSVLQNVGPDTRIIFVGDPDQLPPIEWGEPFIQLIETGIVPVARLTKIFRTAEGSKIAEACKMVNEGQIPVGDNDEVIIVEVDNAKKMAEQFMRAWRYYKANFSELGRQSLTPLNKRDIVGRQALNALIQGEDNPFGEEIYGTDIRIGDRVVCTVNNYFKETRNGMTGNAIEATLAAKSLKEALKYADKRQQNQLLEDYFDRDMMVVQYDDEDGVTTYALNEFDEVIPAYSMTIHKSQGNQFDVVIVTLPRLPEPMKLRQIVYTGMSRAKKRLVVISEKGELADCVRNEKKLRRYSQMSNMFLDVYAEEHIDMLGWKEEVI